jgi:hypothetical protein
MTARMREAGWKIWRIDAPMTEHDAKILTLGQWWRRTQRGGFGFAQAWQATAALPQRLYTKQLRSAFFWVVLLPLAVIVLAAVIGKGWIFLAMPAAYALQWARIASRSSAPHQWTNAGLTLLAKVPEAVGVARFFMTGGAHAVPEYKAHG